MTLIIDRIEIESVGSDPAALAAALIAQLQDLKPPVPIHEIALALDINAIEERLLHSIEGCLQTDQHKSYGIIAVNATSKPRRQRFTIAHELGHFLNERHWPNKAGAFECSTQDMSNPRGVPQHITQEKEANRFAIEVLAPHALMANSLAQQPDLDRACTLACDLDISREAAIRRYVELHPHNIAAIFSHDDKIRYIEKGPDFPHLTVWNGNILPDTPLSPRDGSDLTDMTEADARGWLSQPHGKELLSQTLFQQRGYATTLLFLE